MRRLYLFGGGFVNFDQSPATFVEAVGGNSPRIGLLFSDRKHIGP